MRRLGRLVAELARHAAIYPTALFVLHLVLSLGLDAYSRWPVLDLPMHVAGGLAIAAFSTLGLDAAERQELIARSRGLLRGLVVLGLTALAAILWELGEFAVDRWIDAGAQAGLADTMLDQALGLAGGLIVAVATVRRA